MYFRRLCTILCFFTLILCFSNLIEAETLKFVKIQNIKIYYKLYKSPDPRAKTVVFESGFPYGMSTWDKVAPKVAKFATVLVYDRPGEGNSPPTIQSTWLSNY